VTVGLLGKFIMGDHPHLDEYTSVSNSTNEYKNVFSVFHRTV